MPRPQTEMALRLIGIKTREFGRRWISAQESVRRRSLWFRLSVVAQTPMSFPDARACMCAVFRARSGESSGAWTLRSARAVE
jgi:hypothetical protein